MTRSIKRIRQFLLALTACVWATVLIASAVQAEETAAQSSISVLTEEKTEESQAEESQTQEDAAKEETEEETAVDISDASVTLSKTVYTYSGKEKKPSVTVKIKCSGSAVTLKKNTDYTVSYHNNTNVGTATVKIKGKGSYTGTVKATYKIKPKATAISSLAGVSKGFTIAWKKVSSQASGYQIQYATNKSFTKGKGTITVSGKKRKARR